MKEVQKNVLLWLLVSSFFFIENVCGFSISVVGDEIKQDLALNHTEYALLAASFLAAYSCMMIPAGLCLDAFLLNHVMSYAMSTFAVGCFIFAIGNSFSLLLMGRILMGASAAFSLLGSLKFARSTFSDHLGLFSSLALSVGMIGGVVGKTPTLYLVKVMQLGKSGVFGVFGFVALAFAVLVRYLVPAEVMKRSVSAFSLQASKRIISQRNFWLIALYGSFCYSPFLAMETVWAKKLLSEMLPGIRLLVINSIESIPFLGVIIGSIILGMVSDGASSRKGWLIISALGVAITLMMFLYVLPRNIVIISLILFFFGFFTGGFMPCFAYLLEHYPAHMSGSALGLMNCVNMMGGAVFTPVIGKAVDTLSVGTHLTYVEIYQISFMFLPILALFASALISKVTDN